MAGGDSALVWREAAGRDREILSGMISQGDTGAAVRIDGYIKAAAPAGAEGPRQRIAG